MKRDQAKARLAKDVPAWKRESFVDRALKCAGFLRCHELLSDREREAVHRRMMRMVEQAGGGGKT